jgi:hypothetical protein
MKAIELIDNYRTNLETGGSMIKDYTDQHVMYMLDAARAVLAGQKLDAGVNIQKMSQVLDLVPEKASLKELGSYGNASVISVTIPNPVLFSNGVGILTVGSTDGSEIYPQVDFSQLRTILYRKHTSNSPKWIYLENKIYIVNRDVDSASKIRVRGIFDEPYKVEVAMSRYKYLDPYNFEYPASFKDANTIYKLAISNEFGWSDTAARAITASQQQQENNS